MKRIKLLSTSKQLPLKCWYSLPDNKKLSTILDLKKQLVADLSLPCQPDEFMLEMDEYELLKSSKIKGILRDNDTLSICLTGKKRKASIGIEKTSLTKKMKTAHTEKTKDKPKKIVKVSKHKAADKKDKSKKKDKKVDKKIDEKTSKKTGKKEIKKKDEKKAKKKSNEEVKKKVGKKAITKAKPVEVKVLSKTQKRNFRRKLLKQIKRDSKKNNDNQQQQQEEKEPESNGIVDLTAEQVNDSEMVDYNPYGRALVTSIECAPNYNPKKKNKNRSFTPREYPVHKVPQLFYAQHHIESYFTPPTSDGLEYDNQDAYMENGVKDSEETQVIKDIEEEDDDENDEDEDEDDEEEEEEDEEEEDEEEEKNDDEEKDKEQQATTAVEIDYDTLAVLNFQDNPPQPNDRLAIKMLELTSTYTPEISGWKHVLLKQIDPQAETVVVEFEKGFGKASTKGGKFDIRKKKKRNNWYRGRRYANYEDEDEEEVEEEQTDEQDKEEEPATVLMMNIFEMRKLN
ncbi:hypothetical protein K501DRAFT_334704 [Backusella circina FSU 941]|nr:hypothetical protein K501DRAFT_334704 [Backusella circina FSU 941]